MCAKQTVSTTTTTTRMVFDCMKPDATAQQLGIENGGCADATSVVSAGAGSPPAGIEIPKMEICLCDTDLCNTDTATTTTTTEDASASASKKAFATFLGFFFLLNIVI